MGFLCRFTSALPLLCLSIPLRIEAYNPQAFSQKSVVRETLWGGSRIGTRSSTPSMAATIRQPIRMPSQTPQVPYMPPGSDYAQFIDIESAMYRDRTLFISKFIDEETANNLIAILLYLRDEDPREPISMYFNVPGALLRPSLALYDLIEQTKQNCEIETVNLGLCAGMGAYLCGAGTKGRRFAMPNARFLLQRTGITGQEPFRGQATDIALEVKNVKLWNDRMEKELSAMTGQKIDQIQQDLKRDFYLTSDEAVQYGLIDAVLLPSPRKRSGAVEEANLGDFAGDDDQKYGGEGGGGWGSRRDEPPPNNGGGGGNNNDDGPKIAKG